MSKVYVCLNNSCTAAGATDLVRDLEELAWGQAGVVEWGCLGRCGKGPNLELEVDGKKKVVEGIKTFKKACGMLEEKVGVEISGTRKKIGKIKYEARREGDPEKCQKKLQSGFDLLGGEDNKKQDDPVNLSGLLLIRARKFLKVDAAAALVDAEKSLSLTPTWKQAYLAQTLALEANERYGDALKSLNALFELGGPPKIPATIALKRLQRMAAEEAEAAKASKDESPAQAAAEGAAAKSPGSPAAKSAPAQQTKTSAKAKAKKKPAKKKQPETDAAVKKKQPEPDETAKKQPESVPEVVVPAAPVIEQPPAEVFEEEEPPELLEWSIDRILKLNHNCVQFTLTCDNLKGIARQQAEGFNVWHVDIAKAVGPRPEAEEPGAAEAEFAASAPGADTRRSYTPLSNLEDYRKGTLELMVKIYPTGALTPYLATLRPGNTLMITAPIVTRRSEDFVAGLAMVAGGSAVTVAIQFCKAVLEAHPPNSVPVTLLLCNSSTKDVLYGEIFARLLDDHPTFKMIHCISAGDVPENPLGRPAWRAGRLIGEVLAQIDADSQGVVSGPSGLCQAVLDLWKGIGRKEDDLSILDSLPEEPEEPEEPEKLGEAQPEQATMSSGNQELASATPVVPKRPASIWCGVFSPFGCPASAATDADDHE